MFLEGCHGDLVLFGGEAAGFVRQPSRRFSVIIRHEGCIFRTQVFSLELFPDGPTIESELNELIYLRRVPPAGLWLVAKREYHLPIGYQ